MLQEAKKKSVNRRICSSLIFPVFCMSSDCLLLGLSFLCGFKASPSNNVAAVLLVCCLSTRRIFWKVRNIFTWIQVYKIYIGNLIYPCISRYKYNRADFQRIFAADEQNCKQQKRRKWSRSSRSRMADFLQDTESDRPKLSTRGNSRTQGHVRNSF